MGKKRERPQQGDSVLMERSGEHCLKCGVELWRISPDIEGWQFYCQRCRVLTVPPRELEKAREGIGPEGGLIVFAIPCRIDLEGDAPQAEEPGERDRPVDVAVTPPREESTSRRPEQTEGAPPKHSPREGEQKPQQPREQEQKPQGQQRRPPLTGRQGRDRRNA